MTQLPCVFVTGTQRCGTTLVCRILDAHPDLNVVNEVITPDEIDKIFCSGDSSSQIISFLQQKRVPFNNMKSWGLKHPYLTYHLKDIYEQFPNAKIVIVMRDGRAVANSYLKVKWGIANIYAAAKRWRQEVQIQNAYMSKYPGTAYLLRYEHLLTEPENTIKEVCDFLDLKFNQAMLEFYKKPAGFKQHDHNINTSRAIDPSIMSKWRKQLTKWQVKVFEEVAGETLIENKYLLEGKKIYIPNFMRWCYELHQRIVGELQIQYKWRFQGKFLKNR